MAKSKPDKINIPYNYWGRFLTRNLYVEPSLLGAIQEFDFEGYLIKIELPSIQELSKEHESSRRITCESWQANEDGENIPVEYIIHNVDLRIFGNKAKLLPTEILNRPAKCFDLFTEEEQEELNSIVDKFHAIADRAFDHWVRHIRWKSNIGSIARPLLHGHESGWAPALESINNAKPIWYAKTVIIIEPRQRVTKDIWSLTQDSLRDGIEPPLFYDYFFDGEENLYNGYYRRALTDFCISVESALRELLEGKIPDELHPELKNYLSGVSISTLKGSKFQKAIFDESTLANFEKDQIFRHLSDMFENRNKLMHYGELKDQVKQGLGKYREVTKRFIDSVHTLMN